MGNTTQHSAEPTPHTPANKYFENTGMINGETMMDTGELANGISRRKIFIHALSAYKTLYPNSRTVFYLDGRISIEKINGSEVTVIKTANPVV